MRLLYVCSDFGIAPDGSKGASIHLRAITGALASIGHEVLLISPRAGPGEGHPARRLLPPGCPLVDDAVKPLKKFLLDHELGDELPRDLRSLYYSAYAVDAAKERLSEIGKIDAVIERLSLFSTVGLDLAKKLDCPLILEVNALLTEEAEQYRTLLLRDMAREIEHRTLQQADAILPVSHELGRRLIDRGSPANKVHVTPNGADDAFFKVDRMDAAARRAAMGLSDAFVIGFVGSLKPWHGVDVLLRAAANLHDAGRPVKALIVGVGPQDQSLRMLASELGLNGHVVFTGAIDHATVPAMVAAMDVAIAPFQAIDHFYFSPIKLFEYMAAGACVVASRVGQIASVIEHEQDGLLCPPNDPAALALAIDRLRQSPELRKRLGAAARVKAGQQYAWTHTAQLVSTVIERTCVARRGSVPPAPAPQLAQC